MTFGNNIYFPFNYCTNNELFNINNSDRYIPSDPIISNLPNHKISEQAFRVSNINPIDNDYNINLSNLSGCEYYSCPDFHKLLSSNNNINKNNVNIFHNNL